MTIVHIALWTPDLDQTAEFWRDCFGATVGEAYHSARRPGFVSRFLTLPGGGARVELMTGPWVEAAAPGDRIGWDHLAVSLGSPAAVDALAARCAGRGCLVAAPRTTGDGFYEAVVAQPDGTRIEVTA